MTATPAIPAARTAPRIPAARTVPAKAAAPAAPAAAKAAAVAAPVAKLRAVAEWAGRSTVGRADLIRLVTLAVAAGQNALLLGAPGTAKTMAVRKIASAFAANDGDVFEVLLTKFSKPYEVLGPTDLRGLEEGRVEVNAAGFLPAARVGILDEVFKGSSAILNALLTLANERTWKNGAKTERSPLRTIVGMSNEGPEDPALLAAFYDRFALKLTVEYLDGDDFAAMLRAVREPDASKCPVEITEADFAALDRLVAACEFADDLVGVLASIRATLKAKGVVVSDRRYAQCVRLLKAAAVLDGRNAVSRRDLSVLEYVLWNQPAERAIIRALLPDYANPHERELRAILDELHAQRGEVLKAANYTPAGGTPADTTRPSPDLVAAAGEAAKAYGRAKSIATRLDLIEPDTDSDREAHALACQHAEAVVEAIKLVAKGQRGLDELAALTGAL